MCAFFAFLSPGNLSVTETRYWGIRVFDIVERQGSDMIFLDARRSSLWLATCVTQCTLSKVLWDVRYGSYTLQ